MSGKTWRTTGDAVKTTVKQLKQLVKEAIKPSRTDKWKAPEWLKPGVRVRIAHGRKWPIGATGTVMDVYTTGNGAKASVMPDPECKEWWDQIHPLAVDVVKDSGVTVWIANLELAQ